MLWHPREDVVFVANDLPTNAAADGAASLNLAQDCRGPQTPGRLPPLVASGLRERIKMDHISWYTRNSGTWQEKLNNGYLCHELGETKKWLNSNYLFF